MLVNLYLFWGAWQDLRKRKINNSYLWIGGVTGIIYKAISVATNTSILKDWLWAMIPGLMLLLVAIVTKEKIGLGDGWVILILSNFLNVVEIGYVLQAAVFIVSMFSLILLCSNKVTKEYQIPFLPFLWAAHTCLWVVEYV